MYRRALNYIEDWSKRGNRKPLVIRGARQTGKSTLVRLFCEKHNLTLFEINFEEDESYETIFQTHDISTIKLQLEIKFGKKIETSSSCLFLDEIQASPKAFTTLRYFYEKNPDLKVIAAGSLLELVMQQEGFSVPVGRLEYLFLGPMNFEEYLLASGNEQLVSFLESYIPGEEIPPAIHLEAMKEVRFFTSIGGMPEVVQTWVDQKSMLDTERIHHSILTTFRDDLYKYRRFYDDELLISTLSSFPNFVGKKIVYAQFDRTKKPRDVEKALHLLEQARIIYRVCHSSGNGVPLGAEKKANKQKGLFLDVGLLSASLGLTISDFNAPESIMLINKGVIAEQFIGQHLLYQNDFFKYPELFYWSREKSQSGAEVDFLVSKGNTVIPIEVKSGKTGTLRSLHSFVGQKKQSLGIRFYTDAPRTDRVTSSIPGEKYTFTLISLPLYLVGRVRSYLDANFM